MSAQAGVLIACERLQDNLNNYFQTCSDMSEPIPFFEYLMSPLNRGPLSQVIAPGNSKTRDIRLRYTPRITVADVDEDQTHPTCEATTTRGDRWTDYSIDVTQNIRIEELMTLSDWYDVCRGNGEILAEKIAKMVDAMERKAAYRAAEEAILLAGQWGTDVTADASDNLEVQTFRTGTTDELYSLTMQDIKWATAQSGYCDNYAIFTGTTLAKYADAIRLGCCADTGIDLAATFAKWGSAVMYDKPIATAFADEDQALVVQNGALQLLTWNLYDGPDGINRLIQPDYVQNVIFGPRTGLPIDLLMKHDCGNWHIVMTATTKVVGLPTDMFAAGDLYEGVTFVNKVEVVNS